MIRIGVHGASGRTGSLVKDVVGMYDDIVLSYEYSRSNGGDIDELCASSDVVIDFSSNEALAVLLACNANYNTKLVIGTTGLTDGVYNMMVDLSLGAPVLYSANMSYMMAVMCGLVRRAALCLPECDIQIIDVHKKEKKDAPSGTALMLEQHAGGGAMYSSIRLSNSLGEHQVLFGGIDERLEITHRVFNNKVYAIGALKAAIWLMNQRNGLYNLGDIYEECN